MSAPRRDPPGGADGVAREEVGPDAGAASDPGVDVAADPELARHAAELRARLRSACREWDEAAFEALVLHIARTKVRWTRAES